MAICPIHPKCIDKFALNEKFWSRCWQKDIRQINKIVAFLACVSRISFRGRLAVSILFIEHLAFYITFFFIRLSRPYTFLHSYTESDKGKSLENRLGRRLYERVWGSREPRGEYIRRDRIKRIYTGWNWAWGLHLKGMPIDPFGGYTVCRRW